ncbi:protein-glutamate O-methyltransferase CheR [Clostridium sp. KNHs214]|uniref:CheR family methyltransferase n=1 Tax=Clostridium sp. KNHs214 TaxID=1540257 RepID=UPI00055487F1|nr:protein-glutamate O-methyltransferase CheR [Clostridium sp. KNHs214]
MDLFEFEKWVFREFNIDLSAYKSNQLHRRIESLMSRVGVKSVDEYTRVLKTNPKQKEKFLDFITINVTEFFRNPEIFDELSKVLRDELLPLKRPLKIWSAACSTGAEPYSLAMILNVLDPGVKHKILATDIDKNILEKAKKGEYGESEIKNIKKAYLDKYFKKLDDKYIISDSIKSMVNFKKHDLILDNYENNFDLIVCRNVVIYFKPEIKNSIYSKFGRAMNKGSLLFVGATESIYNYRDFGFEKSSTFIYKKS